MPGIPLFLVGSGFIGGSILMALIQEGKHEIAVLCRDEKKAETLKGLGVKPVMGTLDSEDVIAKETANSDIVRSRSFFGRGWGPFNKISIQIPGWIKESVREKRVISHGPEKFWNNISIKNLVPGYLTLLAHMEKTQEPPLYVFCETGCHQWGPAGAHLDKLLKARGLVSQDLIEDPNPSMETACGTMSRSKAELLREWGWEAHDTQTLEQSMEEDIDFMRAEKLI
ncbi:hypothetical protein JCM1841_004786 [Sporobolomyces salmonicolor]